MKKVLNALKNVLCTVVCLGIVLLGAMWFSSSYRSDPADLRSYETTTPHIRSVTDISAHRSGGGIAPEQTMMAIKNCADQDEFRVDVFELDLHITRDGVLVLLHDDTLDRTSDSRQVFGEADVRPEEKTYEELRLLNMGAQFVDEQGNRPFAELSGEDVPDDLKIVRLEDVLDYLSGMGDYRFILEMKNSGDLGRQGVDVLYRLLSERGMVDKVAFGTFHEEISEYVDEMYPDLARSTSLKEVIEFWLAALTNSKRYEPPCTVLQIPFCEEYLRYGINLGTARVVNYAHSHNMAVQYWTIDDPEEMAYLVSIGADCVMTDYPDLLYDVIYGEN